VLIYYVIRSDITHDSSFISYYKQCLLGLELPHSLLAQVRQLREGPKY
jgi:hypothetical protein